MIPSKVIKKELVSRGIAHLFLRPLKEFKKPTPGQFVMLWVPGHEEIPMSISDYSDGVIRITVKDRGPTTNYLIYDLPVGSYLGVRGPLGIGITNDMIMGRGLFIVGGVGIAPIAYLIKSYHPLVRECKLLAGFVSRDEASVVDELRSYLSVEVVNEELDWMTVIDLLKKELSNKARYDYYIASGPKAVLDHTVVMMPKNVIGYLLTESFMKCGIGFCGSCAMKGFLVCKDGTLIRADKYVDLIS